MALIFLFGLKEGVDGDKAHIHATINYAIQPQLVNTTTPNPLCKWRRVVPKRVPCWSHFPVAR